MSEWVSDSVTEWVCARVITQSVTWDDERMERGKYEILALLRKPRRSYDIRSLREI